MSAENAIPSDKPEEQAKHDALGSDAEGKPKLAVGQLGPAIRVELTKSKNIENATWTIQRLSHVISKGVMANEKHSHLFRIIQNQRSRLRLLRKVTLSDPLDSYRTRRNLQLTPYEISLPASYGKILFHIANSIENPVVIEAGSGFGVSGMYLAGGISTRQGSAFFSFEVEPYWSIASQSIGLVYPAAFLFNEPFEHFPSHLSPKTRFNLAFLDAVHDYDSTMHYMMILREWMAPNGIIIIDDIQFNESIRQAWKKIISRNDVLFAALIGKRFGFIELA